MYEGSIHVGKVKEKLDRSLCLGEFDVGKRNTPMIR